MKQENFLNSFGKIDPAYIEEADATIAGQGAASSRPHRRRFPIALVAAIMCLFLMGAGVVAVIYGDSIQSMFSHYWEAVTGQEMNNDHTALIEQLSQDISQSQTVGCVTVTVDSATVGDNCFFLLLRAEGLEFSKKHAYVFDEITMEVVPDPAVGGEALVGYGFQFHGIDGDGSALFLMDYNYSEATDFVQSTDPFEVTLRLKDLYQEFTRGDGEALAEGEWYFAFSLDRSQPIASKELPDAEILATDRDTKEEVPVVLSNIVLTNTGIRFRFSPDGGSVHLEPHIYAILKDGTRVTNGGGSGHPAVDDSGLNWSFTWSVPINIEDVAAIRFGGTDIPVGP